MTRWSAVCFTCSVCLVLGCTSEPPLDGEADALGTAEGTSCTLPVIDPARSLLVTDAAALAHFSLKDVMDRIVASAGPGNQTSLELYRQWWDLNNNELYAQTSGPHCDDYGYAEINGFPVDCPRQEGILAATNPFGGGKDAYATLALVNRFDLAPKSGADCGEYRIIYGKVSGQSPLGALDRVLLIFEARLPNPQPSMGLEGCRPVAELWAGLSTNPDAASRASLLRSFYFDGLPSFAPVIHWSHYQGSGSGQIRANQFMMGRAYFTGLPLAQQWQLREYFLTRSCNAGSCSLRMLPTSVKNNPFGGLFFLLSGPHSEAFRTDFVDNQVELLLGDDPDEDDPNKLAMATPESFNAGQSSQQDLSNDYAAQFLGNLAFRSAVQAELDERGSSLTPEDIVARATTQSCAGCHQVSNGDQLGGGMTWPSSNTFTHVSETGQLSPALVGTFLPHRALVLASFLTSDCMGAMGDRPPGGTLGGATTH